MDTNQLLSLVQRLRIQRSQGSAQPKRLVRIKVTWITLNRISANNPQGTTRQQHKKASRLKACHGAVVSLATVTNVDCNRHSRLSCLLSMATARHNCLKRLGLTWFQRQRTAKVKTPYEEMPPWPLPDTQPPAMPSARIQEFNHNGLVASGSQAML
jgi:hypothetical protein